MNMGTVCRVDKVERGGPVYLPETYGNGSVGLRCEAP